MASNTHPPRRGEPRPPRNDGALLIEDGPFALSGPAGTAIIVQLAMDAEQYGLSVHAFRQVRPNWWTHYQKAPPPLASAMRTAAADRQNRIRRCAETMTVAVVALLVAVLLVLGYLALHPEDNTIIYLAGYEASLS